MESEKYDKLVNITEKKQTHSCRQQTSGGREGEALLGWGSGRYKLLESKNYNKLVNITKNKQTLYIYREQTSGYPWGEGGGTGNIGVGD